MSVKLMAAIWKRKMTRSERIVLLAMADHADDQGNNIFPSIAFIAYKTDYSERQVQRIIHGLIKRGTLQEVEPATHRRAATYCIDLNRAPIKAPFKRRQNVIPYDGRQNVTPGVTQPRHPRGDTATSPEPSVQSSVQSSDSLPAAQRRAMSDPVSQSRKPGNPVTPHSRDRAKLFDQLVGLFCLDPVEAVLDETIRQWSEWLIPVGADHPGLAELAQREPIFKDRLNDFLRFMNEQQSGPVDMATFADLAGRYLSSKLHDQYSARAEYSNKGYRRLATAW